MDWFVLFLVGLALFFDFLNGFHDAANSIATIVSTRVLTPRRAVIWAAFFNFIAFLFFGLHVAGTIGRGIVTSLSSTRRDLRNARGGLSLEYFHLVFRPSHQLVACADRKPDRRGAGQKRPRFARMARHHQNDAVHIHIADAGAGAWPCSRRNRYRLFKNKAPLQVDHLFRKGQLISAALYSLGHGGNDAQKTMGIIAGLLFSAGMLGPRSIFRSGWLYPVRQRSRWAQCSAAGGS
jgi:PiT family inorganic phosphate transporter